MGFQRFTFPAVLMFLMPCLLGQTPAPAFAGELSMQPLPLRIDWFGRWSYAVALAPYYALLCALVVRYRVILRFTTWKSFFAVSALLFVVLGLLFEWIADLLYVWTFPEGRDLFRIKVPIFGWFTGQEIPVCEFLWILGVVPLFYYLYLWATLVFYDIIYVVDEHGETYKKEERWAGFHRPTRILTRKKGMKGQENECELFRRNPGFVARATRRMTMLILATFVPVSIWAQNKAVESGSWHYRPHGEYLLWITKDGEGWERWTRHLWLGNDMPAMEYLFYPLFCLFQITLFTLYSHLLPDRWFEQEHPKLRLVFPIVITMVVAAFVAIYFRFPNPNVTDYLYWLAGVGYAITLTAYIVSRRYRAYTQSPAFWIWAVGMGGVFMVCWEFFHCCLNHDWIYNRANTFPFYVSYNGFGIPVSELLGYLTTATTFKALILLSILEFGSVVTKDQRLIPLCKPQIQPT